MNTLSQVTKYISINDTEQALNAIDDLTGDDISLGNVIKSTLLTDRGDFLHSIRIAEDLLRNEHESDEIKFGAVMSKMNAYWRLGKYKKIPDLIIQGDEYLESLNYRKSDVLQWLVGKYYNGKGNYYWDIGNLNEANKFYNKSLEISTVIENEIEIARSLNNLGNINYRKGNYELALQNYEMNLEIKRQSCSSIDVSPALSNIGAVYLDMGRLKDALSYFQESLDSINRNEKSDLSAIAFRYSNIGYIHGLVGNLSDALSYFENAILIYKEIDNEYLRARTTGYLGHTLYSLNCQEEAENNLERSLTILEEFENDYEISKVLYTLIIVKIELNKISEAKGLLVKFNNIVKSNTNDIIKMRFQLADAMISMNHSRLTDKFKAFDTFNEIIKNPKMNELIKNEARVGICEILLMEYKIIENADIIEEISTIIGQIYKYGQREHAFPYLIKSLEFKSKVLIKQGKIGKALEILEIGEFYADERNLNLEKTRLEKVRQQIIQNSSVREVFHKRFDGNYQDNQNREIIEYLEELKKFKFNN